MFRKALLFLIVGFLVPNVSFAKEDKIKCDNIYLLSDYFENLDLDKFDISTVPSNSFLISARSCEFDLSARKLVLSGVDNIVPLPLPAEPLRLESPARLDVNLSFWNTVLVIELLEVGNGEREIYLTIYGNIREEGRYVLVTPRFRYY